MTDREGWTICPTGAAEQDYLAVAVAAVETLRTEWAMANEPMDGANWPMAVATAEFLDAVESWTHGRLPRAYPVGGSQ